MAGFGVRDVEPSGSAITMLVTLINLHIITMSLKNAAK